MLNKGKILRSSKGDGATFTCIDNCILQSKEMTSDEICLLVHLISLPLEWSIVKGQFHKRMKMGRDKLNKAWKGLESKGYIITEPLKNGNLICGYFHKVYENPKLDNPKFGVTESQSVDIPVNKESNKKENNNIIESNNIVIDTSIEKQKVDISTHLSLPTDRDEIIKLLNENLENIISVMPHFEQHLPKRIIESGWKYIFDNDIERLLMYWNKYLEKNNIPTG